MKKVGLVLTTVFVLFSSALLAAGINFNNKSWQDLLAQAKKENKIIFLDAYASWCGPCKYMQNDVFIDESVGEVFNAAFINAKIDMELGEGPSLSTTFGITAYPTLLFISPQGNVVHKFVGALDKDGLIELAKHAQDPKKQYYTLKAKAEKGDMDVKSFHEWVHVAEKMDDADLSGILKNYMKTAQSTFLEKEMLQLIFDHGAAMDEAQLTEVHKNSATVMRLLNVTEDEFADAFTKTVVSFALSITLKADIINFETFKSIVSKFLPAEAEIQTQLMRVENSFHNDDDVIAFKEFAKLIEVKSYNLSAKELSNLVIQYGKKIAKSHKAADYLEKVKSYQLSQKDTGFEYYKDMALMILYYVTDDTKSTKVMAQKLNGYKNLPSEFQGYVDEVLKL